MIINHNIAALNTHRQLSTNTAATSKSIEKLSSGLRINRAGDDAAGLAISEKMRGQIRGLDMAAKNSQDGISLIQTAEGALNETHSILQRMRELAVQSSNDTNTAADREKLQAETDQLAKEITRISNTTEFNTKNLLAGGLNSTFHIGANAGQNISVSVNGMDAKTLGVSGDLITSTLTGASGVTGISQANTDLGAGAKVTVTKTAADETTDKGSFTGAATTDITGYTGSEDLSIQFEATAISAGGKVDSIKFSTDGGTTWNTKSLTGTAFDLGNGVKISIADDALNVVGNKGTVDVTAASATVQLSNAAGNIGSAVTVKSNQSGVLVGDANSGRTANISLDFANIPTTAADVAITQTTTASTTAVTDANGNVTSQANTQKGINISTQASANAAITVINNALESVSAERSKLGAVQNRLDHTINNLNTSSENLTAAESRVRDVDMAKEMMNQTKNSILAQAAQAMLAQANQQPQGVLQLLR